MLSISTTNINKYFIYPTIIIKKMKIILQIRKIKGQSRETPAPPVWYTTREEREET